MRVLITGASGVIGRRTAEVLADGGHEVWGVSRTTREPGGGIVRWVAWDPARGPAPEGAMDGVEAVVNLAGEPIADGRWSEVRKRAIRESRAVGTRNLVASMGRLAHPPKVLVSGSAVGFYGDRGDEVLDEAAAPGKGFLAEVVVAWEAEAAKASELGIRVVKLRTGVVLSRSGGALAKMLLPFKLGVGGRLGSGEQWFPWIHLEDEVGLIAWALSRPEASGPLNAVAPQAVTNRELTQALGRVLHRPTALPVPAFGLKLAFGEMSTALLDSQRVVPRAAEQLGYRFVYPELEPALEACVGPGVSRA